MEAIQYNILEETIYFEKLNNGLEVYILPKKDFHKTAAALTVKFGSVDKNFVLSGEDSITLPDGLAHFLEHKMFDCKDWNVFDRFARLGVNVNAFTSFTRTAYTISAASSVHESLETLLDFVQEPYFTDEAVEKEKGIIEQEIKMYDDNPGWRAQFGVLDNLYTSHPVKIDLAGTAASIRSITKEDLYTCYQTFYHPGNMLLFVVGPVSPEETMELIRQNQEHKNFPQKVEASCIFADEDRGVNRSSSVMRMPVPIPQVLVGYKETKPLRRGRELLKYELAVNVLLELMFGISSEAYNTMYNLGYVDSSFHFEYTSEKNFGFTIIGGNSCEPEKVISCINETIQRFKTESIPEEDAERVIKKEIGRFLSSINSLQFIANQFTRYRSNDTDLFDVLPALEQLTQSDLEDVLHLHFSDESKTTLVVKDY